MRLLLAAILSFAAMPAEAAEPIVGRASVIDGDTVEIRGQRIRLQGIDAPESRQECLDSDGTKYRCGQSSSLALDDHLQGKGPLSCQPVDKDRYGRVVAVCSIGGKDIADWMVSNGHAFDWSQYSKGAYEKAQEAAQAAKAGMWKGTFLWPWEWRRAQRR